MINYVILRREPVWPGGNEVFSYKQTEPDSIPFWTVFLVKTRGFWTVSCDFAPPPLSPALSVNDTQKCLSRGSTVHNAE